MDEDREHRQQESKQGTEAAERDPMLANLPFLRKIKDLAERTGISDRTLYHWAKEGEFGYYLFRGMIMIDVREFEQWLQRNYHPPKPKLTPLRPPESKPQGKDQDAPDESS